MILSIKIKILSFGENQLFQSSRFPEPLRTLLLLPSTELLLSLRSQLTVSSSGNPALTAQTVSGIP